MMNGFSHGIPIGRWWWLKVFLPILVIFSSAFRVIASSPLLSDLIQGVCNDISIHWILFSEIYFWSHQSMHSGDHCKGQDPHAHHHGHYHYHVHDVFCLTLFSGPDESAAVPVIDPANPSQDFSPPASPTWGKKGSQNWKIYLFQRAFNIGRAL